jgi:3-oxoacyl-[acyl-carrier protein] reductase
MAMGLDGRVAVVTGAGQSIGREIALALARDGADVGVLDVKAEAAEATAADCRALGRRAVAVPCDVSRPEDVSSAAERIAAELGPALILVNNAGVTRDQLLLRMDERDWDLVLNVNLKGTYNATKAFVRGMTKSRWGRIVNIASVIGVIGNAGQANYAASKAGIIGFTKSVAKEFSSRQITVNAVAPGFIDTPMTQVLSEKVRGELLERIPLGRLGTASDVAGVVRFLCSEEASYVTGQVLHCDGGMVM